MTRYCCQVNAASPLLLSLICWGPPLALALEAALLLLEGAEADEDIIGLEVARGGDEAEIISLISQLRIINLNYQAVPVAVEGDAALSHMDSAGGVAEGSLLARQGGEGCGRC